MKIYESLITKSRFNFWKCNVFFLSNF